MAVLAGLFFIFAGCGPAEEVAVEQELPTENVITIGFSQIGSESDWRMASTASIQEAFAASPSYNLLFSDGQQKQENQIKAMREFIDQDVDYILLDPCIETGWDSALLEAKEAGIPVIVFDRDVTADENLYTSWIGSDFYLEGQRALAWLEVYLRRERSEDPVHFVGIQGTIGATAQIGRTRALEEAAASHENWVLLEEQPGDYTTAKGKEVMETFLASYGDEIDIVYCENDNEAYGAIEALEERGLHAGMNPGKGDVLVLSFDATEDGLKYTLDKRIAVDTECSPLYGPILVKMIEALERGEEIPKRTYIEEGQFSSFGRIRTLLVGDQIYSVTHLTEDILKEREY